MFRNDPENETDFIFIYHGWIFYGFSSQIVCNERTGNEKLQCSRVLQREGDNCGLCVLYLINFFTGSSPLWKIFAQHDVYISSEARLGYLLSLFTVVSFWSTFLFNNVSKCVIYGSMNVRYDYPSWKERINWD